MKNLSTHCVVKIMEKGKKQDGRKAMPCRQTMHFLTQFARGYHVEPLTQKDLCGFILN
ncbi:MAG: hypothetical protein LBS88_07700 [Tannerellaceae bacterium]|jgi:hypothetical protein|nr:hypothetical protein [Tannerellaceae bacterium]